LELNESAIALVSWQPNSVFIFHSTTGSPEEAQQGSNSWPLDSFRQLDASSLPPHLGAHPVPRGQTLVQKAARDAVRSSRNVLIEHKRVSDEISYATTFGQ